MRCVCVCVFECVLELFLETAAVGSIIRSGSADIPRMPSRASDPGGENIGETKETDTREEVAFHRFFRRGQLRSAGTRSAVTHTALGDTYCCNTWDRITSSEDAGSLNMVI